MKKQTAVIPAMPVRGARGQAALERALLKWVSRRTDSIVVHAARTVLLVRRDALYDAALAIADSGLRAVAVARAQGIEEAVSLLELVLRP